MINSVIREDSDRSSSDPILNLDELQLACNEIAKNHCIIHLDSLRGSPEPLPLDQKIFVRSDDRSIDMIQDLEHKSESDETALDMLYTNSLPQTCFKILNGSEEKITDSQEGAPLSVVARPLKRACRIQWAVETEGKKNSSQDIPFANSSE